MSYGEEIGQISVVQNTPTPEKKPQELDPSAFTNDNLKFDEVKGWTLEGTTEKLQENVPYGYGRNIFVYANWRKKLETEVWCNDETQQGIEENLRDEVLVQGGFENDENRTYSYFSPTETALLTIPRANTNNVLISNGQSYKFLGWSLSIPEPTSRNVFEDSRINYQVGPNISFDSNYLKTYYACFLKGTEIKIKVKTNQSSLNNGTVQYNYTLNGQIRAAMFSDTFFNMDQNDFGSNFTCTQNQSTPTGTIFVFKGWYIGDYDDPDHMPQTSSFIENTSITLLAMRQQIIVTAVYLPATTGTYTITYYSGL